MVGIEGMEKMAALYGRIPMVIITALTGRALIVGIHVGLDDVMIHAGKACPRAKRRPIAVPRSRTGSRVNQGTGRGGPTAWCPTGSREEVVAIVRVCDCTG